MNEPTYTDSQIPIEEEAFSLLLQTFDQHQQPRQVFHTYQLAVSTTEVIRAVCREQGATAAADKLIATLASCFLHIGHAFDVQHPLPHAMREIRTFFSRQPFAEADRIEVVQCLQAVAHGKPPTTQAERILSDAWQIACYLRDPEERFALLRLEWDLLDQRHPDKDEWLAIQQEKLLGIQLHTPYARRAYEPVRARYLMQVRDKLQKQDKKKRETLPPTSAPFSNLEQTDPVRATQTFFRANYRNHINLSAIADNKANIMISVNTILLSVLIAFLSYQNIGQTKPIILLPVVIFLVTGLASLIFAVLSAKPKVTALNNEKRSRDEVRRNLVFFGNFVALDLPEYEEAMDELFRDSALLYGNMVRDLYHLGKVLEKKYRYLTVSYNIFMVGFIATVVSFLIVLFS